MLISIIWLFITIKPKNISKYLLDKDVQIFTHSGENVIYFDHQKQIFSVAKPQEKSLLASKSRISKVKDKEYTISFDNKNICYSTSSKKLTACIDGSNAKGRLWRIKKKGDYYEIKSIKKTGILFWGKKWCLTAHETSLNVSECEKDDKKQLFKIENFNENVDSSDDKEENRGSLENENENENESSDENEDKNTEDQEIEEENNESKPKIGTELEKPDLKESQKTDKNDILEITGNDPIEESILKKIIEGGNEKTGSDTDKFSTIMNKKRGEPIFAGTPSSFDQLLEKILEKQHKNEFMGGSFGIPAKESGSLDNLDTGINSKKIKSKGGFDTDKRTSQSDQEITITTTINPLKTAAINLLLGIDSYLSEKSLSKNPHSSLPSKYEEVFNSVSNMECAIEKMKNFFSGNRKIKGSLSKIIESAKELEKEIKVEKSHDKNEFLDVIKSKGLIKNKNKLDNLLDKLPIEDIKDIEDLKKSLSLSNNENKSENESSDNKEKDLENQSEFRKDKKEDKENSRNNLLDKIKNAGIKYGGLFDDAKEKIGAIVKRLNQREKNDKKKKKENSNDDDSSSS